MKSFHFDTKKKLKFPVQRSQAAAERADHKRRRSIIDSYI